MSQEPQKTTLDHLIELLSTRGVDIGLKLLGAFAIWIGGRMAIRTVVRMADAALERRGTDKTLVRYAHSLLSISLTVALVMAVLGFCGVETASFAALLAAAGVAIGMAWAGLLANFAAGVCMLVLKPFKVGDEVSVGGVTGVVRELGLFATTIESSDGVMTYVGNNKCFSDNIQNMTASKHRRVDLVAQLPFGADVEPVKTQLLAAVAAIPHVLTTPTPVVQVLAFSPLGVVLAVRPFCDNLNYASVYFATNQVIHAVCEQEQLPAPFSVQKAV